MEFLLCVSLAALALSRVDQMRKKQRSKKRLRQFKALQPPVQFPPLALRPKH